MARRPEPGIRARDVRAARVFALRAPAPVRTIARPDPGAAARGVHVTSARSRSLEARPAIELALNRFARASVYENWLAKAEQRALAEAICVGDELPQPAAISLADLLLLAG